MEVYCGAIVLDSVLDVDDDGISPAGFNKWAWELAVYHLRNFGEAIGADYFLGDL